MKFETCPVGVAIQNKFRTGLGEFKKPLKRIIKSPSPGPRALVDGVEPIAEETVPLGPHETLPDRINDFLSIPGIYPLVQRVLPGCELLPCPPDARSSERIFLKDAKCGPRSVRRFGCLVIFGFIAVRYFRWEKLIRPA